MVLRCFFFSTFVRGIDISTCVAARLSLANESLLLGRLSYLQVGNYTNVKAFPRICDAQNASAMHEAYICQDTQSPTNGLNTSFLYHALLAAEFLGDDSRKDPPGMRLVHGPGGVRTG